MFIYNFFYICDAAPADIGTVVCCPVTFIIALAPILPFDPVQVRYKVVDTDGVYENEPDIPGFNHVVGI